MANVLLTHSYFLRFDPKQWKLRKPYPPLGTLYAAAALRARGHDVALHDTMFASGPEGVAAVLESHRADVLAIYDDGFNYLTKMCLTNMRQAAHRMAQLAAERGVRVLACSSDSTDHAEEYLRAGVDCVVLGEGEEAVCEIVERWQAGLDIEDVAGTACLVDDRLQRSAPRPVIRDLDGLAPPAWDLVDPAPYRQAWQRHGRWSLNAVTTRGCPYKCNWCAKPIYGNRYNSHSPARVADDLLSLHERFGPDHIWFCDDIFGLKKGWVQLFSEEMRQRDLHLPFMIQTRADLLTRDDAVPALAAAGCETAWMGAESGSQRVLDAMDKGTRIEQIAEARGRLADHGVAAAFFLQFGYLGETVDEVRQTLDLLFGLRPDDLGISVSYPLPGTPFYERVKDDLVAGGKTNWSDSDDLAMMFRSEHSPEFYRRLHRWVHRAYRRVQHQETLAGRPPRGFEYRRPLRSRLRSAAVLPYFRTREWMEKRRLGSLGYDLELPVT